MSISRRGDGRYIVKYKDKDGVWKQKSFKSYADAEKFEQGDTSNSDLTLSEAISIYLDNNKICSNNTKVYAHIVECIPKDILSKQVCMLVRKDLEAIRKSLHTSRTKAVSINVYTRYIKTAINWCVDQEFISVNTLAKYKNLQNEPTVHRDANIADIILVYNSLPDWAQWAAKTVINLCLRPGVELCNLTWDNFNWEKQSVTVYMSKTKRTKEVFVSDEYIEEAVKHMVTSKCKYVCPNSKGVKLQYKTFSNTWDKRSRKLGLSVPPYALRHMAASKLIELGADIATVANQLGHVNATTTMKYYVHSMDNKQKEAATILSNNLSKLFK